MATMLEKMQRGHTTGPNSTEAALKNIYENVYRQLTGDKESNKIAQDQQDALILENYLNAIVRQNTNDTILALDNNTTIINAIQKIMPTIQMPKVVTGAELENIYANIIESTFTNAESEKYIKISQTANTHTGTERVDLLAGLENDIKEKVRMSYIKIGEYVNQNIKNKTQSSSTYQTVQGKIDASGLGFQYQIIQKNENISKILELLQSSVSLKAYKTRNVKVGDQGANFFRAFYSVAAAANMQATTINSVFWKMLNCIRFHHSPTVVSYIRKIRLIYELTGIGQKYIGKENEDIDYLNNSTMRFIIRYDGLFHVQPVSVLLFNMIGADDTRYMQRINQIGSNQPMDTKAIESLLYGSIHVTI